MKQNEQKLLERIRSEYTEKTATELDDLRKLHARIKRPAEIFAYSYGSAGSLVLGTGMCLAMKVIGSAMVPGIAIGAAGIGMVSTTYALYKRLLAERRKRYKGEITALCDKIDGSDGEK